ncbi:MAG: TetR/AcrR family transcriptional regulator [Ramlibacter sp.]|nr:TetR/AcrR family transcriptional regulator [Ramlibacter sp.]
MTETDFPVSTTTASEHRSRLLEGMAQAVAKKGYADTTIADVVREASVSRRTFYEHFDTKAECLVALYEATSHNTLRVLRGSIDPQRDWQAQLEQALTAYLGSMAQNPVLLRTLFIEILGLGATGLAARRRTHNEIAGFILEVVNAGGRQQIDPQMAMAVVGGVNELVLQAIERERPDEILAAVGTASAFVKAVTNRA